MTEESTRTLLSRYQTSGDEQAFATIVDRYAGLVRGTAAQLLSDDGGAVEDICQVVFIDLAQRSRRLEGSFLGGWLYRRTRFAASDYRKAEKRRRRREQNAHEGGDAMIPPKEEPTEIAEAVASALHELKSTDQNALVLRYYENFSLKQIGDTLGTSDGAAQKRVSRALERIKDLLQARGVTASASAIVASLAFDRAEALPFGYAASVTAKAITAAQLSNVSTQTNVLSMITLPKIFAVAAGVLSIVAICLYVRERSKNESLASQLQVLQAATVPSFPEEDTPALVNKDASQPEPPPTEQAALVDHTPEQIRKRAERRATKRYADLLEKMSTKFQLSASQAEALKAFYDNRQTEATRFYEMALSPTSSIDPSLYYLDVGYWEHIPAPIQELLTEEQLADYQAYEEEQRINHIETFTNGEIGFLQETLDITSEQKDALYTPLGAVYTTETGEDLSVIQSLDDISERKDLDNQRRREFFATVLTPQQMEKWEEIAEGYKQSMLRRYGASEESEPQ